MRRTHPAPAVIVGTAPPWRLAVLPPAATRAWPFLPVPCPCGFIVGADGTVVKVDEVGRVAVVNWPNYAW